MVVIDNGNGQLISVADSKDSIPMIGSDGKLYSVPNTSQEQALQNGWKFAEAGKPTPDQPPPITPQNVEDAAREQKVQAGVAEAEKHPIITGLKRFGNEFAFGALEVASDLSLDPEGRQIQQEVRKRVDEAHPIANILERGAGMVSSALIPGIGEAGDAARAAVLGEHAVASVAEHAGVSAAEHASATAIGEQAVKTVADKGVARQIAATTAKYASEGALMSTPQAAVQAYYGDPEQAAETMAWGTGLSGILGLGIGGVTAGGKALLGAGAHGISDFLNNPDAAGRKNIDSIIAKQVLGMSSGEMNKMENIRPGRVSQLVDLLQENGILGKSGKNLTSSIEKLNTDAGKQVGSFIKDIADPLVKDNPDLQLHVKTGGVMANELRDDLFTKIPELKTDLHADTAAFANKVIAEVDKLGTAPIPSDIWTVAKNIEAKGNKFGDDSVRGEVIKLASGKLRSDLSNSMQNIFAESDGQIGKFAEYEKAKQTFSLTKDLVDNFNPEKSVGKLPDLTKGALGIHGVLAGAALLSGHVGVAAGMGSLIVKRMVAKFAKNEGLAMSAGILKKISNNPDTANIFGGLMARAGQEAFAKKVEDIPQYLTMSKILTRTVVEANPFKHATGDDSVGLSKDQQYNKLVQAITSATTNQKQTIQNVGHMASVFAGSNVGLATSVVSKNLNALNYLQQSIPKNPNAGKPFQQGNDWEPTASQKSDFMKRVGLVNNPMVAMVHYQEGTMDKIDREVLTTVYPKVYQAIVNKIMQSAHDPRLPALTYDQRMQLSSLTGVALDDSLKNGAAMQAAITTAPAAQSFPTNKGGTSKKMPSGQRQREPKWDNFPSLQTDTQRRSNK